MESYSVEAVLSAVDKNFTSTMSKADSSMGNLDKSSQSTNTSILDIAKGVGVFKLVDSAVGMVRNSVDGAIDRFDTLNKYPVVMQALGYSTEEVDKSMQKLNNGIDGLPTSLNEIVSSTQQIAIATGSLDKGTDTAIALNNAFLASGASTADASRGMQQYVQMLSKGTVDMQSWRSIQETMPVAMDKVAKSFKDQGVNSVNELYDALQSGDITFDDFNNRLIELNEGVGGFADLAQKNSAGIKTSFANIKTAVTKGLANIFTAIDDGMKNAGLGSIAENLDKVKVLVNQAFNGIVKVIPPVIKGITDFVNIIKPLNPILIPIISTLGVFFTLLGAVKIVQSMTTAIGVFNATLMANPVLMVVAAIIVLIGTFAYLWNTSEDFRNFWIGLWDSIKDIAGAVADWFKDAWDNTLKWVQNKWSGLTSFFSNLWEGIKSVFNSTTEWLQSAPSKAADFVQNKWNEITTFFSNLWNGIKENTSAAWDSITQVIAPYAEMLKTIFSPLIDWFGTLWDSIKTISASMWEIIKAVVMGPVLILIDLVTGNFTQLKDDVSMLWTTLSTNIQTIVTTFVEVVVGLYQAWGTTVFNIWTTLVDTITGLWQSFTTWITNTTKMIVDTILQFWNNFKQGTIDAYNGTVQWVKDTWSAFKQWIGDTTNSLVKGVTQSWDSLKQWTIDTFNSMVDGAKQAWDDLVNSVVSLVDNVTHTFDQLGDINLLEIGKAIMDSFVKGLQDAWQAGMDFIGGIGDWIREHKGPIRKDKKLLIPAGLAIMDSLNNGLQSGFSSVQSSVSGMGDLIAEAVNSDYSVDVGANVAAANQSIKSEMSHDVNLNKGKQPGIVNVRIGKQQFKAFVEDISNAQGQEIIMSTQY
ncbi:tape measure protein [Lactococcus petauri]|uniref:tape measure protein n=1 Tax=Lactococcus petauri TaxID=1940789 RepID=UPI0022E1AA2F|nr:tape measure protein [Lactococcus petauri]